MLRLFLLLLFLGPLSIVFQACNPCDCPPSQTKKLKVLKTELRAMTFDTHANPIEIADSGKASHLNTAIKFDVYSTLTASLHFPSLFINEAMACDCTQDQLVNNQQIESITIYTVNDFNANYKAGSIINNITRVFNVPFNDWYSDYTLNFKHKSSLSESYDLTFIEPMELEQWQQLRIIYKVSGETYDVTTQVFWLY